MDADPKGFEAYSKALVDPLARAFETALNVVQHNPEYPAL
jgi:hypothetical protein